MKTSIHEAAFELAWRALYPDLPPPVREHVFAPPRRWRFDFAWPDQRVAIEIEGGVWNNGRHNRAAGFIGACEKYNAAVMRGWRVLRFAGHQLDDMAACCAAVVELMEQETK